MLRRPLLRHWPIAALREWLLWVVRLCLKFGETELLRRER